MLGKGCEGAAPASKRSALRAHREKEFVGGDVPDAPWWESDEEDEEEEEEEDPHYDPKDDEKNDVWVRERQRRGLDEHERARKSDAVLSCPSCLVDVCGDCQKHDVYPGQFRAMFVTNCRVVEGEVLSYGEDEYHPVMCSVCGVEVAVIDREEVFHFFNVIASS